MGTNHNNEDQVMILKSQDFEIGIKKEQELFNEYCNKYNNNKTLLASTGTIQNQFVLKDRYTKIKASYQQALDTLNKICDLCKEISSQIDEYRETKKTNRKNMILDFLFTRRALSHMSRDYIDTTDLKYGLVAQKDDLVHYYHQYNDELMKLDKLLKDYPLEYESGNNYRLDCQDLIINIDKNIYKSGDDIETLLKLSQEIRLKLLERVLYYYKKRNEIYKVILGML